MACHVDIFAERTQNQPPSDGSGPGRAQRYLSAATAVLDAEFAPGVDQ